MRGIAGDGQYRAACRLQQARVVQQPLGDGRPVCLAAQDGPGSVGHITIRKDQNGQVLLVAVGVGAVNDILVKGIGGLGAHAADDTQSVFIHGDSPFVSSGRVGGLCPDQLDGLLPGEVLDRQLRDAQVGEKAVDLPLVVGLGLLRGVPLGQQEQGVLLFLRILHDSDGAEGDGTAKIGGVLPGNHLVLVHHAEGGLVAGADSALADLPEEGSEEINPEAAMFNSKIWTNAEGKIVGREFGFTDETGTESYPLISWKNPSADGNSALYFELWLDTSSITLTGSGQSGDQGLTGEYLLAFDGVKTVGIGVNNLKSDTEAPGYMNGSFNFSLLDTGTEEEPNPLAAFGLTANIISDAAAQTSQVDLSLTSSGAPVVTLSVTGGYEASGESVEMPDQAVLDAALSVESEEDMTAFAEGLDWTTVLTNLGAAGVPEELINQLQMMLTAPDAAAAEVPETVTEESAA